MLVLSALLVAPVMAQDDAVHIATGFAPDPLRLEGQTVGARPLSSMAPGCRGYVGPEADHVLQLDSQFAFLRFFVTASEGVTLAVHGPDDRWHCSGRPLLGAPREQGAFAPGRYEVWIGSTTARTQVPYELAVTEFPSVSPATGRSAEATPVGGGAELGLDTRAETGRFRDRRLRRGFLPDPREDGGEAGGAIEAGPLGGGCRGSVEAAPSHVLTLRDDLDYFRISIASEGGPTSLIVRTPSGAFLCSAPDDGDPAIERAAWPEGVYRIWVGARQPEARPRYRVQYTETRPPAQ